MKKETCYCCGGSGHKDGIGILVYMTKEWYRWPFNYLACPCCKGYGFRSKEVFDESTRIREDRKPKKG